MDLQDIWNDESLKLAKPVTEWKRYCEQTEIKKIKVIKDKVNLVYLNLYDNVWIMAVLKMLQTFSTPRESIFTLDELLIHRRLARNDGRNFFLSDSPSPIGLITSLGYIYKEKTGQVGILFPVYDYSIDQVPLEEMTSDLRYEIFTQVLSGLKTMHSWGYRHNDVKLENILISKPMPFLSSKKEKRPEIVLADFGLSDIGKCNLQTVQTLPYRPFECYEDPREKETGTRTGTYSRKTDVYAFMCTYLALTRKSPIKNNNCYVLQFQSGIFHERKDHVWNFFKKIENQTLDSYYRKCTTHASIYYNPKSLDEENRKSIIFEKDDWMSDSIIKACLAMDPLKRLTSFQLAKFFLISNEMKKKKEIKVKKESRITKLHLDLVEMLGAYDHQFQVYSFNSDFHIGSDFGSNVNLNKILFDILVRETGLDLDFLNVLNFLLRTRKW